MQGAVAAVPPDAKTHGHGPCGSTERCRGRPATLSVLASATRLRFGWVFCVRPEG